MEWTNTAASYYAGLFDGDGCVTCSRSGKYFYFRATIEMCDPEPLIPLANHYDKKLVEHHVRTGSRKSFRIAFTSRDMADFLCHILPHLKLKYPQCILALDYSALPSYQREQAVSRIRAMNAVGLAGRCEKQ